MAKNFGGRPKREPEAGERVHLGFRVTPETKAKVEAAAAAGGRSISQESELRLERSFEQQALLPQVLALAYGDHLAGVLMAIGAAMRDGCQSARFITGAALKPDQPLESPYAFDQAVIAANAILERLRPPGDRTAPRNILAGLRDAGGPDFDDRDKYVGAISANGVAYAIAGNGATGRLQKEGAEIAQLLGPIAERLKRKADDDAR